MRWALSMSFSGLPGGLNYAIYIVTEWSFRSCSESRW